jgi:hypothetical protein
VSLFFLVFFFWFYSTATFSESVFGYITVLGAFSAYRYIALQNDWNGEGPLQKYFLGEGKVGLLSFLHVVLI